MGRGNMYKRRLKIFTLALAVYCDYKAVQKRVEWFSKKKKDALWEKTHERNARRVLNLMIELEGLWVKLGQYLSTRADVLPQAYIFLLKQLQDSLPPRPLEEIAQVHRATLKDGQEVVVKVQHEGIKEVILEDLKNAKSIIEWIAWAEPQYDFSPMINEWCREAPKELDFNHEADNTRKVSKNLHVDRGNDSTDHPNHVDVLIPEVIQSSEKVLILQYMDGIRLNDKEKLEAFGVDKQKLVEEITRAYAHQIYVDGFFNGDPHPGNFLVSKEPSHCPILLDFGLTKSISSTMKQALAKMFLACAEGDHVTLLSAFAEMGLKFRLDMPEQAMSIASVFFRTSTPANEALENVKSLNNQREKNMKAIQEKMKLSKKEIQHFNPVDAFPGDIIIFMRVLNLLRGLSSTLDVRIVYLNIMRPFAEAALIGSIPTGPATNKDWIFDSPAHSDLEVKLRRLLIEIGNDKILGIQVCAYKDGEVIVDTAAGVRGRYDPRPVQPDTLFPVFSVTKGITAGMVHWLVDKRILKFDETIANIWPEFKNDKKDLIKVHHVLNHTSGLHNAMSDILKSNPLLMCDWEEALHHIARLVPETEPGSHQLYHYLSFGWLCGGIIEHASGKKFQEVLEEAIVRPLNIEGELYIGIPPGVESRLATLTLDTEDLKKLSNITANVELPASLRQSNIAEMASTLPVLFNTLNIRRAIIPAANGHLTARALARYYAALATGGSVPPPHSNLSQPALGSHAHDPTSPTVKLPKRRWFHKEDVDGSNAGETDTRTVTVSNQGYSLIDNKSAKVASGVSNRIFTNPKIHDAIMGYGDYSDMVMANGKFGLGFRRFTTSNGKPVTSFGHSGVGGSSGFCDIEHNFSIAVTVNKMSLGSVTRSIIQLVCSELKIPLPEEFTRFGERGPDMQLNLD